MDGDAFRGARDLLGLSVAEFERIVLEGGEASSERSWDLVRIARALAILLPSERAPANWMRVSNKAPLFNGCSAMELLSARPEALAQIRQYLEAQLQR